jgi:hypothetical protein
MIPLSTLSPSRRQLSNNRPEPLDPSVLRFSRLFQASEDVDVSQLRQIVDVHYKSTEIEGLLSELDEVDSSSDDDSDIMEWSYSEGQPPRTKVHSLGKWFKLSVRCGVGYSTYGDGLDRIRLATLCSEIRPVQGPRRLEIGT